MAPLVLALAACAACAARAGAETAPATSSSSARSTPQREKADEPPAAETRTGDAAAASPTAAPPSAAAPTTQQKVARALDPEPGGDVCTGYAFDGVSLDVPKDALAALPLVRVARADSAIEGFEDRTFGFRAARPGRIDDVQVGFSEGTPAVMHIHAQVLVAESDAWPRTLFDRLGNPKNARLGEWIWWDLSCGATLRLTKVEALGEASESSYTLEVRHTLKPAE